MYKEQKQLSLDESTSDSDSSQLNVTGHTNFLSIPETPLSAALSAGGDLRGLAISLPEIKVEDFSDNSDNGENSATGVFRVFNSMPRERANTCPDDLFLRRKPDGRPGTPPPSPSKNPFGHLPRKKKNSFPSRRLTQLSEDFIEDEFTRSPFGTRKGGKKTKHSATLQPYSGMLGTTERTRSHLPLRRCDGGKFSLCEALIPSFTGLAVENNSISPSQTENSFPVKNIDTRATTENDTGEQLRVH